MARRQSLLITLLLLAIGLACGSAESPRGSAQPTPRSAFDGPAPDGFLWQREAGLTQCLVPTRPDTAMQEVTTWTDSAAIVALAYRFMGSRVSPLTVLPERFVPSSNGTLIQLADTTTDILDGSVTLYITRYGCVTHLGW